MFCLGQHGSLHSIYRFLLFNFGELKMDLYFSFDNWLCFISSSLFSFWSLFLVLHICHFSSHHFLLGCSLYILCMDLIPLAASIISPFFLTPQSVISSRLSFSAALLDKFDAFSLCYYLDLWALWRNRFLHIYI